MAQDFPNNPTLGQVFGSYVWNGTAWAGIGSANNLGVQVGGILAREAYDYHPNYVINGGFDIWQRGTSGVPTGPSTVYVADRWESYRDGYAVGLNVSQVAAGLTGFRYASRFQRASGNTSNAGVTVGYSFPTEESLSLVGKTMVLSFYAKVGANYSANNFSAYIATGTGTDQPFRVGYTSRGNAATVSPVLTTSWQRFSCTGTISSSVNQIGVTFTWTPTGTAGANDYIDITGVQLEEGSVATPFRRNANSIQGELAACQRYYTRYSLPVGAILGVGHCYFTSGAYIGVHYPTEMRSTPASLDYSSLSYFNIYSGGINRVPTSIGLASGASSTKTALIGFAGATGFTAGYGAWLEANNASAYIGFSAEL